MHYFGEKLKWLWRLLYSITLVRADMQVLNEATSNMQTVKLKGSMLILQSLGKYKNKLIGVAPDN